MLSGLWDLQVSPAWEVNTSSSWCTGPERLREPRQASSLTSCHPKCGFRTDYSSTALTSGTRPSCLTRVTAVDGGCEALTRGFALKYISFPPNISLNMHRGAAPSLPTSWEMQLKGRSLPGHTAGPGLAPQAPPTRLGFPDSGRCHHEHKSFSLLSCQGTSGPAAQPAANATDTGLAAGLLRVGGASCRTMGSSHGNLADPHGLPSTTRVPHFRPRTCQKSCPPPSGAPGRLLEDSRWKACINPGQGGMEFTRRTTGVPGGSIPHSSHTEVRDRTLESPGSRASRAHRHTPLWTRVRRPPRVPPAPREKQQSRNQRPLTCAWPVGGAAITGSPRSSKAAAASSGHPAGRTSAPRALATSTHSGRPDRSVPRAKGTATRALPLATAGMRAAAEAAAQGAAGGGGGWHARHRGPGPYKTR